MKVTQLTGDQLQQVADLMSQTRDTEELQKTHQCWFQMPDPTTICHLAKYADKSTCPKCGGKVYVKVFHGGVGDSLFVCCWGKNRVPCDFKESVEFDVERI